MQNLPLFYLVTSLPLFLRHSIHEEGGGVSKYVTCVMRDKCKSCASSFVGSPYIFGSTIVLSDVSLNVVKNISVKSETVY